MKELVYTPEIIEKRIFLVRERQVMLDADLAELYGVSTFNFNKAVKRNLKRFPGDFMFQLGPKEWQNLIFQNGISRWGGRRHRPYVFTEQGVAMLSGILNSDRAIQVNITIMRAFVRMKQVFAAHHALAEKLRELEERLGRLEKTTAAVFDTIEKMLPAPESPKPRIGFLTQVGVSWDDPRRFGGGGPAPRSARRRLCRSIVRPP